VIRTENPFKPGDLVHVKENYISYLEPLSSSRGPALVVQVDGDVVSTLIDGNLYTWVAWDLEEAINGQQ
jgi:hypothetical protein